VTLLRFNKHRLPTQPNNWKPSG